MAVTAGQGNPSWTQEETALALELYYEIGERMPSKTDPHVVELPDFLRSLMVHPEDRRNDKFRNPDGVAFKVGNLRSVLTGKGLSNSSVMDKYIVEEYAAKRTALKEYCEAIRTAQSQIKNGEIDLSESDEDEVVFNEGRMLTKMHLARERKPGLRKALINKRKKAGQLSCDLCKTEPLEVLGDKGLPAFDCHHTRPLAESGRTKTKVSDCSFLCARCHRDVHSAIAMNGKWMLVHEVKHFLGYEDLPNRVRAG